MQLKDAVSKKFNGQPEQLCLIFAGKMMKDHENLTNHNVKDGLTVHLVIKPPRRQNNPDSPPQQAAGMQCICNHY
jgi:ubiquilin